MHALCVYVMYVHLCSGHLQQQTCGDQRKVCGSQFSFYHVSSRNQVQVIQLGSKPLHLLCHLPSPVLVGAPVPAEPSPQPCSGRCFGMPLLLLSCLPGAVLVDALGCPFSLSTAAVVLTSFHSDTVIHKESFC